MVRKSDVVEEEMVRDDKWRVVNWLFFVAALVVLFGSAFVLRPLTFFVNDAHNVNVPTWNILWFVVVLFVLHELVYWSIPKSIGSSMNAYGPLELTVIWKMFSSVVSLIALWIAVNTSVESWIGFGVGVVGVPAAILIVYTYVKLNELKWM